MSHEPHSGGEHNDRLERILADYLRAAETDQPLDQEQLLAQHPDLADELQSFFDNRAALERMAGPLRVGADEPTIGVTSNLSGPGDAGHIRYFGDYELLEEIARGGMGVVYKARQTSLNRLVAVKMILTGQLADESAVRRFRQEAEAAANLDHPQIVPVYEVGEHQGQHYFSMGFVEGQSLAAKLANGPLSPREAAELIEPVARAVHYAHQQGVIHRDLKPANVLLDRHGRPKVTDFGLAKMVSREQSLTDTGQALGTPGYMPPEQVDGKPAGPAADVYGLGAILYALLTGRPPFQAATAMETMLQVLSAEPASPRQLNASVPRDLETIVLKCLEKRPEWRYGTAADVAEELQRFLTGEPILARRAGIVERGARWVRKQRRSVALASGAVAATLLLTFVGIAGWLWYQDWRLGRLTLKTDRPPVVAELLNEQEELAAPAFTIPTQEPVALPAADYRLRVSQPGRLSQSYRLSIARGIFPAELSLNLDDQLLMPPGNDAELPVKRAFALTHRQGRAAVVLLDAKGIHRPDWPSGGDSWSLPLDKLADDKLGAAAPGFRWPWSGVEDYHSFYREAHVLFRPQVVRDPADLDGDGVEEVIVAARHQAWILAISGKSGKTIWLAARGADVASNQFQGQPPATWPRRSSSAVLGAPLVVGDRDRDGVPEILATFADDRGNRIADKDVSPEQAPRRWLECLSGKTGQTLWTFDYDPSWFKLPAGVEIPVEARWMLEVSGHGRGGGSYSNHRGDITREIGGEQAYGEIRLAPYPPVMTHAQGRDVAVTVAGTRLIGIDLATGKTAWEPIDIGLPVVRAPQVADLDGDDQPELLAVQNVLPADAATSPTPYIVPQNEKLKISGWPLANPSSAKWQRTTHATRKAPWRIWSPAKTWPVVDDLDGDGRPEIIVPNATWDSVRYRWLKEVEVFDGATGQSRWMRMLKMMDPQIEDFLVGPDVDGDGSREVFAATLVGDRYDVYVDTLSGKDGRTLSWDSRRIGYSSFLDRVTWWQPGEDGWPQLLVHAIPEADDRPPVLVAFSSLSGRFQAAAEGVGDFQLADGDGDGLNDLFALKFVRPNDPNGGPLTAIRGVANERWRRAGGNWQAAADYDGDEQADLIAIFPSGAPEIAAISGHDGRQLWRATLELGASSWQPWVKPLSFDLDGDKIPDIIVYHGPTGGGAHVAWTKFPVLAISGRTGRIIWHVQQIFSNIEGCVFVEARDLENDGSPEIVFSTFTDWDYPRDGGTSSAWHQHWLAVVDGHTGNIRWRQPLSPQYGLTGPNGVPTARSDAIRGADVHPAIVDLNGDGVADVIMPAEIPNSPGGRFELRATSGRDGKTLWSRPFGQIAYVRDIWQDWSPPAVADVDGDGQLEVLGIEFYVTPAVNVVEKRFACVFALDAATGREKWKWETEVERHCGQAGTDPARQAAKPRVLVLRRSEGLPLIAIGLWGEYQPGRIVVLQSDGKPLVEHPVPAGQLNYFTLRTCDIHDDGDDELLGCQSDLLSAWQVNESQDSKGAQLSTLWKWPIPPGWPQRWVDLLGNGETSDPIAVVQSRNDVFGVSAASGKIQWINSGPQPRDASGQPVWLDAQLLAKSNSDPLAPAVCFRWKDQFVACRTATAISPSAPARYVARGMAPSGDVDDPRIVRKMLWAYDRDRGRDLRRIIWGLLLATFLLWLPGKTLFQIVRQRRFGLKTLLLLPIHLSLIALLLTLPSYTSNPYVSDSVAVRLNLAVIHLPAVVGAGILMRQISQGRWGWLIGFLAGSLVLAVVALLATRALDTRFLGPGERYAWSDLDIPLLIGFYAAGCAAIVVAAVMKLRLMIGASRVRVTAESSVR